MCDFCQGYISYFWPLNLLGWKARPSRERASDHIVVNKGHCRGAGKVVS